MNFDGELEGEVTIRFIHFPVGKNKQSEFSGTEDLSESKGGRSLR